MLSLISSSLSFLMGGLPSILGFFQDRADKQHEIKLAQMQIERELELKKAGFEIEKQIEEIKTEQIKVQAQSRTEELTVQSQQIAVQEKMALLQHDTESAKGASQWVINARAMVRPGIAYGMFLLLVFVDVFGFLYAFKTGVAFDVALSNLWDDDSQVIFSSIIAFYFGGQAFKR